MPNAPKPPLTGIPADIASLADYERLAQQHMSDAAWNHVQAGADGNVTRDDNARAFDRLRLRPRVLCDLREADTSIELFGQRLVHPILLAPVAYQKLAHAAGELETVRAAAAMQTGMVVSTLASVPLEALASASAAACQELGRSLSPLWFQLYFQPERRHTLDLVQRAEAAGYQALVVTVDASFKRSGFALPAGVNAANLQAYAREAAAASSIFDPAVLFHTPLVDQAPRWEDLAWLRAQCKLPLLVKGLLTPEDAQRALDLGADGLIVSNHGGRTLDGVQAAIDALPAIVRAVSADVPVLLDSGIRRGTDVVKAVASGARAVLVGRPQMHALAVAGLVGVAHMLYLLRAEMELAMAQLGCRTLADLRAGALL